MHGFSPTEKRFTYLKTAHFPSNYGVGVAKKLLSGNNTDNSSRLIPQANKSCPLRRVIYNRLSPLASVRSHLEAANQMSLVHRPRLDLLLDRLRRLYRDRDDERRAGPSGFLRRLATEALRGASKYNSTYRLPMYFRSHLSASLT